MGHERGTATSPVSAREESRARGLGPVLARVSGRDDGDSEGEKEKDRDKEAKQKGAEDYKRDKTALRKGYATAFGQLFKEGDEQVEFGEEEEEEEEDEPAPLPGRLKVQMYTGGGKGERLELTFEEEEEEEEEENEEETGNVLKKKPQKSKQKANPPEGFKEKWSRELTELVTRTGGESDEEAVRVVVTSHITAIKSGADDVLEALKEDARTKMDIIRNGVEEQFGTEVAERILREDTPMEEEDEVLEAKSDSPRGKGKRDGKKPPGKRGGKPRRRKDDKKESSEKKHEDTAPKEEESQYDKALGSLREREDKVFRLLQGTRDKNCFMQSKISTLTTETQSRLEEAEERHRRVVAQYEGIIEDYRGTIEVLKIASINPISMSDPHADHMDKKEARREAERLVNEALLQQKHEHKADLMALKMQNITIRSKLDKKQDELLQFEHTHSDALATLTERCRKAELELEVTRTRLGEVQQSYVTMSAEMQMKDAELAKLKAMKPKVIEKAVVRSVDGPKLKEAEAEAAALQARLEEVTRSLDSAHEMFEAKAKEHDATLQELSREMQKMKNDPKLVARLQEVEEELEELHKRADTQSTSKNMQKEMASLLSSQLEGAQSMINELKKMNKMVWRYVEGYLASLQEHLEGSAVECGDETREVLEAVARNITALFDMYVQLKEKYRLERETSAALRVEVEALGNITSEERQQIREAIVAEASLAIEKKIMKDIKVNMRETVWDRMEKWMKSWEKRWSAKKAALLSQREMYLENVVKIIRKSSDAIIAQNTRMTQAANHANAQPSGERAPVCAMCHQPSPSTDPLAPALSPTQTPTSYVAQQPLHPRLYYEEPQRMLPSNGTVVPVGTDIGHTVGTGLGLGAVRGRSPPPGVGTSLGIAGLKDRGGVNPQLMQAQGFGLGFVGAAPVPRTYQEEAAERPVSVPAAPSPRQVCGRVLDLQVKLGVLSGVPTYSVVHTYEQRPKTSQANSVEDPVAANLNTGISYQREREVWDRQLLQQQGYRYKGSPRNKRAGAQEVIPPIPSVGLDGVMGDGRRAVQMKQVLNPITLSSWLMRDDGQDAAQDLTTYVGLSSRPLVGVHDKQRGR